MWRKIKFWFKNIFGKNVEEIISKTDDGDGADPPLPTGDDPPEKQQLQNLPQNQGKKIYKMQNTTNTKNNEHAIGWIPYELRYLEVLTRFRINRNINPGFDDDEPSTNLDDWELPLKDFVRKNNLSKDEAILLLIALAPHLKPDLFDNAIYSVLKDNSDFPAIGGVKGRNSRMFLPTGETAIFLVADGDLDKRLQLQQYFGAENFFWQRKILWLEDMQNGEPAMHGRLIISPDYIDLLSFGRHISPQFSINFPARKIAPDKKPNNYTWDSLVITSDLEEQIQDLRNWLTYNPKLISRYGMQNKLRPGYRALFYGPPGTGKTFTAQIIGNELNKEVYRIDLSMVVSKYIGETEKNLELLFARAEDKDWILFFDEADALFGKRTSVRDAHDKYANQEVSYLLQRIEDYNGLVILATNMKNNIDDAFVRRFNSMMNFPFPDAIMREKIWKKAFPPQTIFREKPMPDPWDSYNDCEPGPPIKQIDIPAIVKKYELSGGSIMNVIQYACLKAVERQDENVKSVASKEMVAEGNQVPLLVENIPNAENGEARLTIYLNDVLKGIRKEMIKEGKPFAF